MKRVYTEVGISHIDIPPEILVHIVRCNEWYLSGCLARCSKSFLRLLTEKALLGEIITHIKTQKIPLFKWLLFYLPSSFMTTDDVICLFENDYSYGKFDGNDISLYVYPSDDDLSIFQHGTKDGIYYQTPLSLYSYVHKEIISTPGNFMIGSYHFTVNNEMRRMCMVREERDIWHYIGLHKDHERTFREHNREPVPLYKCGLCRFNQSPIDPTSDIRIWCDRLVKYMERFETFTVSYCKRKK